MPRRVQDIVPNERRSIRNIPLKDEPSFEHPKTEKTPRKSSSEHSETTKEKGTEIPMHRISVTPPHSHIEKHSKKKHGWLSIILITIVVVMASGWIASVYFSSATFTIVPKRYPVTINGTYIAQAVAGSLLSYEISNITDTASLVVTATESSSVSTKAQGKVTLFNANSQAQRLVAGSRLSTGDEYVYRLKGSLTIPAKSTSGPGTIVAEIIADKPGEGSNITRSGSVGDLKFLGFKGTSRYETVYARLASDITGGLIGSKKIVPPSTLASTSAILKNNLTQKLLSQIQTIIPEGKIMYDNVHVISFSEPTLSGDDPDSAIITIKGTLNAILFDKKELVGRLVEKDTLSSFGAFSYNTSGLEDLDVNIANSKDFSVQKKNSLILRIKGDIAIVGDIPVKEIQAKLTGISLNETKEILKPYNLIIETGSGELIPPWSKVPTDPSRISVIIKDH